MKFTMTSFAALLSLGIMHGAYGQESTPVASAPETHAFALDFTAEADYYNFDESLVVVTPSVGFELFEVLDATVTLPVYNDSASTGLGDINFGVDYTLLQTKLELLGADKFDLAIGGAVGVPLDGDFSSDNPTFTVSGDFGLSWGKLHFNQEAAYLFNTGGEVYIPAFGGYIGDNVFSAASTLNYDCMNKWSFGVELLQFYSDDSQYISAGPTVDWTISNTAALDFSVGFPVSQEDMPYGENDFTVSAGLGFKF